MYPFTLIGLFLALFVNFTAAQNCVSYATSIALLGGSVVNPNNSLGPPNITVADLLDDNDFIVWDMGTVLPVGTQICVRVKKPSSGGNFDFKTWSGASGINVSTGPYTQVASYTNLSYTSLTDKCVTLTTAARYIKVTHEDNSDFSIDAVIASSSQGNAGSDGNTTICSASTSVIMLANLISGESTGGTWSRASGSNGTFDAGAGTFIPAPNATSSTFRYVITGTDGCSNDTSIATITISPSCPTTTTCFAGTKDPTVTAKMITTIIGDKVKIWTQLSKTFVDNTYGDNAIGWNNHSFKMLYQSDMMQLALYDNNNIKKLEFKMDYLSADGSVASGYKSLGVTGGDGAMLTGNASSVVSVCTSLDKIFNEYGYVLTVNSPATDEDFTPNPTYPNWIFEVWYEVVVDLAIFGASGFGKADITGIHASPSKTGDESERMDEGPCCTGQITSVFFKHLGGGANIPVVEGGNYNLSGFNDLYDLEASTSGSVGSVKFTVGPTGQTGTSNTENSSPYNANWDPQSTGSYTVTVKIYVGANLTGEVCDEFTVVFSVVRLGSIGDYVWLDADGDGQQDGSEFPLKGIVVTLTKPDASTVKDTTDANGKYLFTDLTAGTYSVGFAIPAAYMATSSNIGPDNTDSDVNASGVVSGIVLTNGQNDLTIDAGYRMLPDLQPTLSVLPAAFTVKAATGYSRLMQVVVRVNEVLKVVTPGDPIVMRIPRTSKLSFIYDPSLTSLGNFVLQNSHWTFSNTNPVYWEFIYNGPFPAYGESKFGFTATFFSEGETKCMFINLVIAPGSGREINIQNNLDDERIDYITN